MLHIKTIINKKREIILFSNNSIGIKDFRYSPPPSLLSVVDYVSKNIYILSKPLTYTFIESY